MPVNTSNVVKAIQSLTMDRPLEALPSKTKTKNFFRSHIKGNSTDVRQVHKKSIINMRDKLGVEKFIENPQLFKEADVVKDSYSAKMAVWLSAYENFKIITDSGITDKLKRLNYTPAAVKKVNDNVNTLHRNLFYLNSLYSQNSVFAMTTKTNLNHLQLAKNFKENLKNLNPEDLMKEINFSLLSISNILASDSERISVAKELDHKADEARLKDLNSLAFLHLPISFDQDFYDFYRVKSALEFDSVGLQHKIATQIFRVLFDPAESYEFLLGLGSVGKALICSLTTNDWFFGKIQSRHIIPKSFVCFLKILGINLDYLQLIDKKSLSSSGQMLLKELSQLESTAQNEKEKKYLSSVAGFIFGRFLPVGQFSGSDVFKNKNGFASSLSAELQNYKKLDVTKYLRKKNILKKTFHGSHDSFKPVYRKILTKHLDNSSKLRKKQESECIRKKLPRPQLLSLKLQNLQSVINFVESSSPGLNKTIDFSKEISQLLQSSTVPSSQIISTFSNLVREAYFYLLDYSLSSNNFSSLPSINNTVDFSCLSSEDKNKLKVLDTIVELQNLITLLEPSSTLQNKWTEIFSENIDLVNKIELWQKRKKEKLLLVKELEAKSDNFSENEYFNILNENSNYAEMFKNPYNINIFVNLLKSEKEISNLITNKEEPECSRILEIKIEEILGSYIKVWKNLHADFFIFLKQIFTKGVLKHIDKCALLNGFTTEVFFEGVSDIANDYSDVEIKFLLPESLQSLKSGRKSIALDLEQTSRRRSALPPTPSEQNQNAVNFDNLDSGLEVFVKELSKLITSVIKPSSELEAQSLFQLVSEHFSSNGLQRENSRVSLSQKHYSSSLSALLKNLTIKHSLSHDHVNSLVSKLFGDESLVLLENVKHESLKSYFSYVGLPIDENKSTAEKRSQLNEHLNKLPKTDSLKEKIKLVTELSNFFQGLFALSAAGAQVVNQSLDPERVESILKCLFPVDFNKDFISLLSLNQDIYVQRLKNCGDQLSDPFKYFLVKIEKFLSGLAPTRAYVSKIKETIDKFQNLKPNVTLEKKDTYDFKYELLILNLINRSFKNYSNYTQKSGSILYLHAPKILDGIYEKIVHYCKQDAVSQATVENLKRTVLEMSGNVSSYNIQELYDVVLAFDEGFFHGHEFNELIELGLLNSNSLQDSKNILELKKIHADLSDNLSQFLLDSVPWLSGQNFKQYYQNELAYLLEIFDILKSDFDQVIFYESGIQDKIILLHKRSEKFQSLLPFFRKFRELLPKIFSFISIPGKFAEFSPHFKSSDDLESLIISNFFDSVQDFESTTNKFGFLRDFAASLQRFILGDNFQLLYWFSQNQSDDLLNSDLFSIDCNHSYEIFIDIIDKIIGSFLSRRSMPQEKFKNFIKTELNLSVFFAVLKSPYIPLQTKTSTIPVMLGVICKFGREKNIIQDKEFVFDFENFSFETLSPQKTVLTFLGEPVDFERFASLSPKEFGRWLFLVKTYTGFKLSFINKYSWLVLEEFKFLSFDNFESSFINCNSENTYNFEDILKLLKTQTIENFASFYEDDVRVLYADLVKGNFNLYLPQKSKPLQVMVRQNVSNSRLSGDSSSSSDSNNDSIKRFISLVKKSSGGRKSATFNLGSINNSSRYTARQLLDAYSEAISIEENIITDYDFKFNTDNSALYVFYSKYLASMFCKLISREESLSSFSPKLTNLMDEKLNFRNLPSGLLSESYLQNCISLVQTIDTEGNQEHKDTLMENILDSIESIELQYRFIFLAQLKENISSLLYFFDSVLKEIELGGKCVNYVSTMPNEETENIQKFNLTFVVNFLNPERDDELSPSGYLEFCSLPELSSTSS